MNPVHEDQQGWWFWDETWAFRCGPFSSKEDATRCCVEYANVELEGQDPTPGFVWPSGTHWE